MTVPWNGGKMLQTEYVRNLNINYERIPLDKKPEDNRYQYCILGRGGIRGLLSCSLRYINDMAYLYYDISSKQNVTQLFTGRSISREWVKDFLWGMQQLRQELGRFLLDTHNVLWHPEHIFQDLDSSEFSFLYIPYYEGEVSFEELLDFLVEHVDYDDEVLVDCIYHMYEQLERSGEVYLQNQIFEDAKVLNQPLPGKSLEQTEAASDAGTEEVKSVAMQERTEPVRRQREEKKGLRSILEGRRQKNKELREDYRLDMQRAMSGYSVAEELSYDAGECGRTIYIEEKQDESALVHRLYTPEDRLVVELSRPSITLGKKKGEAEVILEDPSVSRIHARITKEGDDIYLEDLNSTNGSFKNGLRLQPYEKKKLQSGDEVKLGRVLLIFR